MANSAAQQIEAPEHILKQLQEIDPNAGLRYMGDGWLLFVKGENRAAKNMAHRTAQTIVNSGLTEKNRARFLFSLWLAQEGIRPIHFYQQRECDERIVEDFRKRDWNWRNRPEEAATEGIEASSDAEEEERKIAVVREALHANKKDMFRILQGNPSSFVPSGGGILVPKGSET